MGASTLLQKLRQKGLKRSLKTAFERYVFFHWELIWTERDLSLPIERFKLREHPPLTRLDITPGNVHRFQRHFGDRVGVMREFAEQGHVGHMWIDEAGDVVGVMWSTTDDYYDKHYYGCTFKVAPGQYFAHSGELIRRYYGTRLSQTAQLTMWECMREKGCTTTIDVVESHNVPAMRLHMRMGYVEMGRITHVYGLFGRWRLFRETTYQGSRLEQLCRPLVRGVATA
ncbi:N-acetyltransferase [Pseudomonas entomophila]|uniref:N-acetyltransferase n=1 Tax=Pseudomonas entomophila TaxID=312306 RepID=UPI0015E404FE|nr:N-acetyltransferase [Pseudomonas entomophila]MBA1190135.1 N-acetyltransferase [Pseudomonas entomophila]